jgi:lysozyme
MPDISHHNCSKDADDNYIPFTREQFTQARTDASAFMLKASQGTDFVSPVFEAHAEAARSAGLPWGAYHFVDPGNGKAQADHFAATVANASSLPAFLCIDWEDGSRDTALALVKQLGTLNLFDRPVGDYIGSHARANGGQLPGMSFHMVPQYGPAEINPDYATDPLSAWQYTNGVINGTSWPASVPGIGACDMSVIYRPEDFGLSR